MTNLKEHLIDCVKEMVLDGHIDDVAYTYFNDKRYEVSIYDEWNPEYDDDTLSAFMEGDDGVYFIHFNDYVREADNGYIIEINDGYFGKETA